MLAVLYRKWANGRTRIGRPIYSLATAIWFITAKKPFLQLRRDRRILLRQTLCYTASHVLSRALSEPGF